jgi:hypothetical protein
MWMYETNIHVGLCTYILKELSVGLGQFGVGYFFNRKLNCVGVGSGVIVQEQVDKSSTY